MENILTTFLSSALLITSLFSIPAPTASQGAFTRVLSDIDYVGYVVEKDTTLAEIALNAYKSDDYWTVVWNDNPMISNPDLVKKDQILRIRMQKPTEPAGLADVLSDRNAALTQQKNDAYLKHIGYQSVVNIQPTTVPTQAPAAATNVPSSISDEAITYLGSCEAGMDPAKNTGNGYYGAFQFSYGTWKSMNTGYERADLAPLEVQKAAVQQLLQRSSIYNQFPGCAKKMRSAGLI